MIARIILFLLIIVLSTMLGVMIMHRTGVHIVSVGMGSCTTVNTTSKPILIVRQLRLPEGVNAYANDTLIKLDLAIELKGHEEVETSIWGKAIIVPEYIVSQHRETTYYGNEALRLFNNYRGYALKVIDVNGSSTVNTRLEVHGIDRMVLLIFIERVHGIKVRESVSYACNMLVDVAYTVSVRARDESFIYRGSALLAILAAATLHFYRSRK